MPGGAYSGVLYEWDAQKYHTESWEMVLSKGGVTGPSCMVQAPLGRLIEQNKASEINIKASLAQFLKVPVKIESIAFGIRPCLIQQRPFAGWSNREPSIGMINGFGGQGVFLAPTVVQSFCRQI